MQPMRFRVDVNSGLIQKAQYTALMKGDKNANRVIVEVVDGGDPVDLTGLLVEGSFIRPPDDARIKLPGTVNGSEAIVIIEEACYRESGGYQLDVELSIGETRRTVLSIKGNVLAKGSGAILDVSGVIPSVDDIVAQYAEMKRVTQETQEAADKANDAAEHVPYIDPTSRHWMEWDAEARKYVDTGIPATGPQGDDGYTPHIGGNGNWFVGENDTGVPAQGPPGKNGTGSGTVTGVKANGQTYEPDDSGVVDLGEQIGEQGPKGDPGPKPVKGTDYWTEADKAEIVNDVLAALPNASGVNF